MFDAPLFSEYKLQANLHIPHIAGIPNLAEIGIGQVCAAAISQIAATSTSGRKDPVGMVRQVKCLKAELQFPLFANLEVLD